MKEFLLIRHGETEYNTAMRFLGATDIGLNGAGREQVRGLGLRIAAEEICAVYSSDLKRCRETCDVLGFGGRAVYTPDLREMNFGEWEGLTYQEIKERYPGSLDAWQTDGFHFRVPGGESLAELSARLVSRFELIRKEMPKGNAVAAVVTHAGCIRTLLTHYLGGNENDLWRYFVENGAAARLCFNRGYAYLKITR